MSGRVGNQSKAGSKLPRFLKIFFVDYYDDASIVKYGKNKRKENH